MIPLLLFLIIVFIGCCWCGTAAVAVVLLTPLFKFIEPTGLMDLERDRLAVVVPLQLPLGKNSAYNNSSSELNASSSFTSSSGSIIGECKRLCASSTSDLTEELLLLLVGAAPPVSPPVPSTMDLMVLLAPSFSSMMSYFTMAFVLDFDWVSQLGEGGLYILIPTCVLIFDTNSFFSKAASRSASTFTLRSRHSSHVNSTS